MKTLVKHWFVPAAMAVLVAACGGGGGGDDSSGGSGNPPPPAGAGKLRFVTGAISDFGSVIVNGVHYESDSASVSLDGRSGSVGQLKVGEVVHIEAEIDSQGKATAKSIEQGRLVQGVVQAVDVAAGTLTIGGILVIVDADTLFDDSIAGASLAGIAVGERIEVHGFAGADGSARATRIEKAGANDFELEFTGPVKALDAVNKRFTVGTQVVDYSTATLERFPASGPAAGDIVEVKGTSTLADGALKAVRVHKEDGSLDGSSGDGGEIEGMVTRFVSATDFDVAGQAVTTNGSTSFVGGTAGDLKLNVKVEAEGTLDSAGKLLAKKIVFKRRSSVKLAGAVVTVDAAGGTFQALGTTVIVNDDTRKEDKVTDNQLFSLADLRTGDWVEVSGYPDPSGSGKVIATRLEKDDARDEADLRGPADQVVAPAFRIMGTSVQTNAGTEFEDGDVRINSTEFFARASGQTVHVDGAWNGSSIVADKAEIEHEDGSVPPPSGGGGGGGSGGSLDGAALYVTNCQRCHGPISPIFNRDSRDALKVQDAINRNKGGMGSLGTLTAAEVQAIADAVRAANP